MLLETFGTTIDRPSPPLPFQFHHASFVADFSKRFGVGIHACLFATPGDGKQCLSLNLLGMQVQTIKRVWSSSPSVHVAVFVHVGFGVTPAPSSRPRTSKEKRRNHRRLHKSETCKVVPPCTTSIFFAPAHVLLPTLLSVPTQDKKPRTKKP